MKVISLHYVIIDIMSKDGILSYGGEIECLQK